MYRNKQYFIDKSTLSLEHQVANVDEKFIVTSIFETHLQNILRIISLSNFAVLLEGPTSVGKTSVIEFLANKIGQKCIRINNNQNTEIEEYIGSYTTDSNGRFFFQEGFLVDAVKNGHWIILDEINLAPSEVLEALNRLLDDNRELFIAEKQKTVKAHPSFRIFAAMNPPELYGGRKELSEAFKNRFIHLFFDNIPTDDLKQIIERRCSQAPSRVATAVKIFEDLQNLRNSEQVFARKEGFITVRDLLKWGGRDMTLNSDLGHEGYSVIAEKLRSSEEKMVVQKVIEKHSEKLLMNDFYDRKFKEFVQKYDCAGLLEGIYLTKVVKRTIVLVDECFKRGEPVLLIGETGCGKTMIVELLSRVYGQKVNTISCHENIEVSDFLGSLRTVYGKTELVQEIKEFVVSVLKKHKLEAKMEEQLECSLENLEMNHVVQLSDYFSKNNLVSETEIDHLNKKVQRTLRLFEWIDGPLVSSMRENSMFSIDDIALVSDSVLERLNSVFEADRVLVLSEKQGESVEIIRPQVEFKIIATMVQGGDHGKRELSPALRSRFSEIFVPEAFSEEDLAEIAEEINECLKNEISKLDIGPVTELFSIIKIKAEQLLSLYTEKESKEEFYTLVIFIYQMFVWFNYKVAPEAQISKRLTLRDIDLVISFLSSNCRSSKAVQFMYKDAFEIVLIDGIFLSEAASAESMQSVKEEVSYFLDSQSQLMIGYVKVPQYKIEDSTVKFGIDSFLERKVSTQGISNFVFNTPSLKKNLLRLLRGLKTKKPLLLEGSPGVGKTTLVQSLAKKLGRKIHRINLSANTEMLDLVGSEYPVSSDSSEGINFKWFDGVLLTAIKNGDWLIIDEMNLASQSILEGLNSVLDHRRTLNVPELNASFQCHPEFQVFATQNPVNQGGGRRFLPRSFLNRFVKIYLEELTEIDYYQILREIPGTDETIINYLLKFLDFTKNVVSEHRLSLAEVGELNLRCLKKLIERIRRTATEITDMINLVIIQRFRDPAIRQILEAKLAEKLQVDSSYRKIGKYRDELQINDYTIPIQTKFPQLDTGFIDGLNSNCDLIKYLAIAVQSNYPVLLVGSPSTGKKEIVRYLAYHTCNKLVEISLNPSMDASELLGNFGKVNVEYHLSDLRDCVVKIQEFLIEKKFSFVTISNISNEFHNFMSSFGSSAQLNAFQKLILEILFAFSDEKAIHLKERFYSTLNRLVNAVNSVANNVYSFEWHNSALIRAVEQGHWLLLDSVNSCNPDLLDRLNSLLDDDKEVNLTEAGEFRTIKPHKNFRVFFSMDPQFGEVSRALKNRCVEIFVPDNTQFAVEETDNKGIRLENINETTVSLELFKKRVLLKKACLHNLIEFVSNKTRIGNELVLTIVYSYLYFTDVIDYRRATNYASFFKAVLKEKYCIEDAFSEANRLFFNAPIRESVEISRLISKFGLALFKEEFKPENESQKLIWFDLNTKNNFLLPLAHLDRPRIAYIQYTMNFKLFNLQIQQQLVSKLTNCSEGKKRSQTVLDSSTISSYICETALNLNFFNCHLINLLYSPENASCLSAISSVVEEADSPSYQKHAKLLEELYSVYLVKIFSMFKKTYSQFEVEMWRSVGFTYLPKILTNKTVHSCSQFMKLKIDEYQLHHDSPMKQELVRKQPEILNLFFSTILELSEYAFEKAYSLFCFLESLSDNQPTLELLRSSPIGFDMIFKNILNQIYENKHFTESMRVNTSLTYPEEILHLKQRKADDTGLRATLTDFRVEDREIIIEDSIYSDEILPILASKEALSKAYEFIEKTINRSIIWEDVSYLILQSEEDFKTTAEKYNFFHKFNKVFSESKQLLLMKLYDAGVDVKNSLEYLPLLNITSSLRLPTFMDSQFDYLISNIASDKVELAKLPFYTCISRLMKSKIETLFKTSILAYDSKDICIEFMETSLTKMYQLIKKENISFNKENMSAKLIEMNYASANLIELVFRNNENVIATIGESFREEFINIEHKVQMLFIFLECCYNRNATHDTKAHHQEPQPRNPSIYRGTNLDEFIKDLITLSSGLQQIDFKSIIKTFELMQNEEIQITKEGLDAINEQNFRLNCVMGNIDKIIDSHYIFYGDAIFFIILCTKIFVCTCQKIILSILCHTTTNVKYNNAYFSFLIVTSRLERGALQQKSVNLNEVNKKIVDEIFSSAEMVKEISGQLKRLNVAELGQNPHFKEFVLIKMFEDTILESTGETINLEDKIGVQADEEAEIKANFPTEMEDFVEKEESEAYICYRIMDYITGGKAPCDLLLKDCRSIFEFAIDTENSKATYYSLDKLPIGYDLAYEYIKNIEFFFSCQPTVSLEENKKPTAECFNFYHSSCPEELKLVYLPLNRLLEKIKWVVEGGNASPTLTIISLIVVEIMNYPVNTPLSQAVSKLHNLASKIHEYKLYTPREFNMEENLQDIMQLIVRFRRKEVESWSNLLKYKIEQYIKEDCNRFFPFILQTAREAVLATGKEEFRGKLEEIIQVLNEFVHNSSMATFPFRLNCLKLLSELAAAYAADNSDRLSDLELLSSSLANLRLYYQNMTPKFEETLQNHVSAVENQIKEMSKISRWEVKNFHSFKDNETRNFRQLNRIFREMDEPLLSKFSLVSESVLKEIRDKDFIFDLSTFIQLEDKHYNVFEHITVQAKARLKALKTLDTNFKHKALVDLLKELKEIGFSHSFKARSESLELKLKEIDLEKQEDRLLDYSYISSINRCCGGLPKLIARVNMLNAVEKYSEDLPLNYYNHMKGYAFSMLHDCLSIYEDVVELNDLKYNLFKAYYLRSFDFVINQSDVFMDKMLKVIWLTRSSVAILQNRFEMKKGVKYENSRLSYFLAEVQALIDFYFYDENYYFLDKDLANLIALLNKMVDELENSVKNVIKIEDFEIQLYGATKKIENIKGLMKEVNKLCVNQELENYSNIQKQAYCEVILSNKRRQGIELDLEAFIIEDENEIMKPDMTKMTAKLKEMTVVASKTVDQALHYMERKQEFPKEFKRNIENSIKYLDNYVHKMSSVLVSLIKLTNLTATVFISLAENGFCKVVEEREMKEQDNYDVHEGGEGMDDGEGMEDITKEIEDIEQMLGLKENAKEDEGKAQDQDEKKGMETNENFEGEMKDNLDKEDEEYEEMQADDNERHFDDVEDADENQMGEGEAEEEGENREVDMRDKKMEVEADKENETVAKENEDQREKDKVEKGENKEKDEFEEAEKEEKVDKEQKIDEDGQEQGDVGDEGEFKEDREEMDEEAGLGAEQKEEPGEEEELSVGSGKEEEEGDEPGEGNGDEEESDGNGKRMEDLDEEMDEEMDDHYESNPVVNEEQDLGYNPIANRDGGGNTALDAKEEQDGKGTEEGEAQKFKQNNDINSLLKSIISEQAAKSEKKNLSKPRNEATEQEGKADMNEFEFDDKMEDVGQPDQEEFNQGYASDEGEKKARGVGQSGNTENAEEIEEIEERTVTQDKREAEKIEQTENPVEKGEIKQDLNDSAIMEDIAQPEEQPVQPERQSMEDYLSQKQRGSTKVLLDAILEPSAQEGFGEGTIIEEKNEFTAWQRSEDYKTAVEVRF